MNEKNNTNGNKYENSFSLQHFMVANEKGEVATVDGSWSDNFCLWHFSNEKFCIYIL